MNKKIMIIGICSLLGILLAINGFSYAKYVSNSVWNYYLNSKGFYFDSEELSINSIKNINNMWDGTSTYFTINNSLNDGVVTEFDINYKVTCTATNSLNEKLACYINGSNSNVFNGTLSSYTSCINNSEDGINVTGYNQSDCELNGYNWSNQIAYKEIYFDVVNLDGLEVKDAVVNIDVASISPYEKHLYGEFVLHRNSSNIGKINTSYNVYNDYNRLVLSNSYSYNKCVQVSFESDDFMVDIESKDVKSYTTASNGYINKFIVNIDSKDSVSYIFYKRKDDAIFDSENFIVEEVSQCN